MGLCYQACHSGQQGPAGRARLALGVSHHLRMLIVSTGRHTCGSQVAKPGWGYGWVYPTQQASLRSAFATAASLKIIKNARCALSSNSSGLEVETGDVDYGTSSRSAGLI